MSMQRRYWMVSRTPYVFSALLFLSGVASTWRAAQAQSTPTAKEIVAAWKDLARRVDAFEYEAQVTRVEMIPRRPLPEINDPFSDPAGEARGRVPETKSELVAVARFRRCGDRWVASFEGDELNGNRSQVISACVSYAFDGTTQRWLRDHREGQDWGAFAARDVPFMGTPFIGEPRAYPFWIWSNPCYWIEALHCRLDLMEVAVDPKSDSNKTFLELFVPHKNKHGALSLLVDKSSPYAIRQATFPRANFPYCIVELQYETLDDRPILSNWNLASFDERRNLVFEMQGKKMRFAQVAHFDDDAFYIPFPVGAEVTEYAKNREMIQWRQGPDGQLERATP
jgi:hypothetical protein